MSIVLNEYEWAERQIRDRELGKKPMETLSRVAKYYLANQYSRQETRKLLDDFLLQCDPKASLVRWSDALDRVVKQADKYKLITLDGISVTSKELEAIQQFKKTQIRRLAFTLLCVAKYWDSISPANNHWVNTSDSEIMQMANIRTSIRRQSEMFKELKDAGLIRFSKKVDNLNVQVAFIDDAPAEMFIVDFRNLGYQYLKYIGEPYFECDNCGLTVKIDNPGHGRRQKYCPECAVKVKLQQTVNSVMRRKAYANKQNIEH